MEANGHARVDRRAGFDDHNDYRTALDYFENEAQATDQRVLQQVRAENAQTSRVVGLLTVA